MRHYDNISTQSKSALLKKSKSNSVTGSPVSVTPDQLGIPITKKVFSWKFANTAADAYIDQYGLPFIFVVNGQQILLPPPVTTGGTPVPRLPDGLTVVYAASFMGVAIPSDFCKPVSNNGALSIAPGECPSAVAQYKGVALSSRASGSPTNALMLNNGVDNGVNKGETLLYVLMSVMENLIYSYSSYPWGNGFNDLSDYIMTKRNYPNFLIPPNKKTFVGSIISDVAPIYVNTIEPIVDTAANIVAPGSGTAAAAAQKALLNPALTKQAAGAKTIVDPTLTTVAIPSSLTPTDAAGNPIAQPVAALSTISPVLLIVGGLLVLVAVYYLAKKSS